jgi:DnaJ-class molecular chaperone
MDYYDTLGVNKSSSPKEIKNAYRKLASKHHPDKGGDADEFKRIQEAYDTLSDSKKKDQYDNPNPFQGFGEGGTPFTDIFGDIFGNQMRRNPDARVSINISPQDAYFGTELDFNTDVGRIKLTIPPGCDSGDTYRYPGKGYHRYKDAPPGNLLVRVNVDMPEEWGRERHDLFIRVGVDAIDAITGTEVDIHHINGKTYRVKIPAGSEQGSRINMRGLGMPIPERGIAGNLYVLIHIDVPTIKDKEIIKVLNTIREKRGNNGK